ncbi:axotactin-like isoform X2 [Littorina saxatilis]|uniref:axotactin-like isoform X2 n=1 Tax=Littorina saxatilis TaxID=31220 RepID=UPI0038B50356
MMRPPDLPLPSRGTLVLVVLALSPFTHTPTRAQTATTTATSSSTSSSSWTFNQPGVSHITFSPPLSDSKVLRLELSFRTLLLNGVLLYQDLEDYAGEGVREEYKPLLHGYHMMVEMRQGHLRVAHVFDHYTHILNIGRALNDDKWHKLTLTLNQTEGEISITLDYNSVTQFLKAYVYGNARRVLDWSQIKSSFRFGGARGARSQDYVSFIGCLRDMKYSTDGAILSDIPAGVREGVTPGCVDRCQGDSDRCKNNGRCVNLYTDFHCDCFGTDYEGRTCEETGSSVLTFSGYEWVTYQLYQGEDNRPFSDRNRVSLEFKTQRPSGILLYAVGGSPYHNHITASIHSGSLHVSVAFGDDDLDFPIGIGLDDNRWHNLTIVHNKRNIDVHLDGDVTSRTVKNSDYFLSLDPLAYIGGGDNFVVTRGLPVTRNLVGCMKNVYYNDYSLLYELSSDTNICTYHGGESPTFGCSPVQDIPISFPNSASMLRWSLGATGENLTVDFQFRTVREDGILFYLELLSRREGGGRDNGLIEVWVMKGHPMLMFMPSYRNEDLTENITLPTIVNDQVWHTMHIELRDRQAKLTVDAVSKSTRKYEKPLGHKGQILLGYGLRGYKQSEGFVGCMDQIVIEGQKLDPITVVESRSAIGLQLDGCYLIDYCSLDNICEHDSRCLSDWDGIQCECQGDAYEGKACHFPRYRQTCDAYYQAGHNQSGVYLIDVDEDGPQDPTYVQCSMGSERDAHLYGATMVEHNFALNTPVRGRLLEDRRYHLSYREMSRVQLMKLGDTSASCEQFFKYTCQQSPILLGKKTWFKAANGQVVDYVGAARSGFCTCPHSDDGTCRGQRCNCDHNNAESTRDEGYSHTKEQLPIMELTFLQDHPSQGKANMTLGPLTCWGSAKQHLNNLVTLATEESHLMLHTWKRGVLGFHFKTHHDRALLLMQTSNDTRFGNKFTVKIVSDNSVEFYFRLNGTVIHEVVRTPRPVNQGDWHYVFIEHDSYNVRLSLDTTRKLVLLDPELNGLLDFNGVMYIGGIPPDVVGNYSETTPGFSGCIRAFLYNEKEVELSALVDGRSAGVSTGCMSSCWPNPCENGGTCKEKWGEYTCLCQDPFAHQGHNCEHNLNADAATFSGETAAYLLFDLSKQPAPLDQTIVMSFRTFQPDALLMYASDHRSNFIQLELQDGETIIFTYNVYGTIVSGSISVEERLDDGEWKQVVAQEYYNLTKLILGDQSEVIPHKRFKLSMYAVADPFKDSIQKETVFMFRSPEEPASFVRLYVGGIGEEGATAIPFLKGCVRGMRIGNYHVNLAQAVLAKGNTSDLTPACDSGCSDDTCLNKGYCYEQWRFGNFTCDCSESDFSGIHCENEASVLLDGQSVLEHTFTLPLSAQRSVTEQLSLNFRTTGTRETNQEGSLMDMALVYIKSSTSGDYILASLDSKGNVLIETNQEVGIYRMKVSGDFANGELHELFYKREGTNMYLTVRPLDSQGSWIIDGVKEASINYPDYDLDEIDTIIIGGLLPEDEYSFEDTTNFTGCIANTVYIPESNLELKIRSLKDFHLDKPEVTVYGPDVMSCLEAMLIGKKVTDAPTRFEVTSDNFELITMPLWGKGPAELVTLSPPVVLTSASTTALPPTTTTANRSKAIIMQNQADDVDDFTVIIAVSVIAVILIIALCIALLVFRKRKKHYDVKKEADIELKQPLNSHAVPPVEASPVPPDHLAKLDEFSMITALLGPRPTKDSAPPDKTEPNANANRNSVGSLPKSDEPTTYEHPIFNKRKQRPASSISEVLEELERRQNSKSSAESIVGRPHGEGDLEWDPQADRTPLTYEDITFFNTPLLAPIPDENEDSHVSSLSEQNSDLKEKEEDSPSGDESHDNQHSLLDGNGDSGYEAESRPEITEEDITPTGDDEGLDADDEATHPKLYMYNISNIDLEDSPILTSPTRRLLRKSSPDS